VGAIVAALGLCLLGALPGQAAIREVTTLADSGPGSLRQVLAEAQEGDTITFGVTGTILLSSGPLIIAQDVHIDGPGADHLTISGNQTSQVFLVQSGVTATIEAVTIRDGHSNSAGGGILNFNDGTLTVTNSTLAGNTALGGGGIANLGTLTVTNSTVADNTAQNGGGIANLGTLTVTNSTLAGNTALGGGGIYNDGTLTIQNTIVATSTSGGDCSVSGSSFIVEGENLATDGTCPGFMQVTAAELHLGPLTNNGGPTLTHALLPGSYAIDAGENTLCANDPVNNLDQRGQPRPLDGDGDGTAVCDIGAYEAQAEALFSFSGFFPPLDNPPTVNLLKAGQAVPVQFSLGGDQGLTIFAADSPTSQPVNCQDGTAENLIEPTVTAGGSGLSYDPDTDTYTYVWKTQKAWAGTCRQLVVTLTDGTEHLATFEFK
jgi:hypothetical protein